MFNRFFAVFATVTALTTGTASAALVTIGKDQGPIMDACFPGNPGCSWDSWDMIQNGFTAQSSVAYFDPGAFLYLHDDSGITESVFASVDGYRFDAVAANARAYSLVNQSADSARPAGDFGDPDFDIWARAAQPAYGNVGWFGYRAGVQVATLIYHQDGDYSDLSFGSSFTNLDALVLRSLIPAGTVDYAMYGPNDALQASTYWCEEWCAGVKLNTLTLNTHVPAPVPLPAAFGPFALALAGVGLAGRRKRRKAA